MAANKLVREPGKYFDCTSMHGKWCTITLVGQDVGYVPCRNYFFRQELYSVSVPG